ncbi:hypothetical protein A4G20_06620 [Pasteurellaceae bacterium RH1A]|nr:hypothetical protein A4G20_06620 [Pasteurellaceae bacterium RH1A]
MKVMKYSLLAMALGLTACGEKDQAYYAKNLDEAKVKLKECEKAFWEGKLKKEDKAFTECLAAEGAVKEQRRIEREKVEAERKAKEQAELEAAKAKMVEQYGSQSWQDFTKTVLNSSCLNTIGFERSSDCRAMETLYNEKINPAIEELKSQGLANLLNTRENYCKQDQRKFSTCDVWKRAAGEQAQVELAQVPYETLLSQEKTYCLKGDYMKIDEPCKTWGNTVKAKNDEIVEAFTKDYEKLKVTYNQCIDQIKKANWDKQYEISSTYPCRHAQDARIKLRLPYDNFDTKMD